MHNIKLPDYIILTDKEKEEILPILADCTPEQAFSFGYLRGMAHGSEKAYKESEKILKNLTQNI